MGKLFDELRALKAEYDRKLEQEGEAALKDAFKDVFDKYPEIKEIYWCQYTPYFNDGDVCHFSVHEFDVSLKCPDDLDSRIEAKETELEASQTAADSERLQKELDLLTSLRDFCEEEWSYGESLYVLKRINDARPQEIAKAVKDLQRELPSDVLESVFGDHARITATREGFSVTEEEHD